MSIIRPMRRMYMILLANEPNLKVYIMHNIRQRAPAHSKSMLPWTAPTTRIEGSQGEGASLIPPTRAPLISQLSTLVLLPPPRFPATPPS